MTRESFFILKLDLIYNQIIIIASANSFAAAAKYIDILWSCLCIHGTIITLQFLICRLVFDDIFVPVLNFFPHSDFANLFFF